MFSITADEDSQKSPLVQKILLHKKMRFSVKYFFSK